jgi:zinc/manganese transport system substrate-binding protein
MPARRHASSTFVTVAAILVVVAGACASRPSGTESGTKASIHVVAAESFWGSIAGQLGGAHAAVQSVISDPNADPHDYESTSADARAIAGADEVVINGAGYDPWADKLVRANARKGRVVLRVADLVGKNDGDNPHLWYDPAFVEQTADRITADYQRLDAPHTAYYAARRASLRQAMQPYHQLIEAIRSSFAGTKVGATETIFEYMAEALGLDLVSPKAFMQAVAEGNDPPAASVAEFQRQLDGGAIKTLVFNAQTATAVTTNLVKQAAGRKLPTVAITETLQPVTATFQAWQERQLRAVQQALQAGVAS